MRSKSRTLYDYSAQFGYDVFVIVETWLNSNVCDGEYLMYTVKIEMWVELDAPEVEVSLLLQKKI